MNAAPRAETPLLGRMTGLAAIVYASIWPIFLVILFVINPSLGLASPADLANPNALLPALQAAPAVIVLPGLDMLIGLSLLVVVLTLSTAVPELTSTARVLFQLATPCGIGAGMLFLVLSTNRVYVLPQLAQLYMHEPTLATTQYALVDHVYTGLSNALRLMFGLWLIGVNSTLLTDKRWPRWLAMVGIALGALNAATFVSVALGFPNLLLMPLWFGCVGWLLLRRRR